MFFFSIVTTIALSTGAYQQYVIDILLTMPDDLITSIVAKSIGGRTDTVATGQGAAQAIEQLYALGTYNASLYTDQAGLSLTDGFNFSPYMYAIMVFAGTVMCCFVGTLWLFIAKIVLALMLAVGPIFIVALCFKPTEQFFYKWLGVVLNTVMSAVLVVAVFSIFSAFFKQNLELLEVTQDSSNFINAAIFFFMGLLCMGVLTQIPSYVSQLTGGAVGAVGSAMASMTSKMAGGAGSIASGASSGATGAVRSGFAGNAAKGAYQSAREGGAGRFEAARGARHEFNKSMAEMKKGYPDYFRKNSSNTQQGKQS